jgi:hypothetical protein
MLERELIEKLAYTVNTLTVSNNRVKRLKIHLKGNALTVKQRGEYTYRVMDETTNIRKNIERIAEIHGIIMGQFNEAL